MAEKEPFKIDMQKTGANTKFLGKFSFSRILLLLETVSKHIKKSKASISIDWEQVVDDGDIVWTAA